jgi:hypothetical protein
MQPLPVLAAHLADGPRGRCCCQWDHHQEGCHAREDEWTLADILHDLRPVEELVEP